MTDFCAHPGGFAALREGNRSGVCRGHLHSPACRCARCRAPRAAVKGKPRRRMPGYRVKTRAEMGAEGLLPGLQPVPEPQPEKGPK